MHAEVSNVKLYEFAPTRSIRVRWMLQELEVPFESVTVDPRRGELRRPEFLAINPAAKLPVLVDGDAVVTESVAIVLYLAEKFPAKGFLPADLVLRGQVYRWLLFAATDLEQPLWRIALHRSLYAEERRSEAEVANARQDFRDVVPVIEQHMRQRQFVVGNGVTAADFVMAYTLDWANMLDLLEGCPNLRAYLERMYARPHAALRIQEAFARIGGGPAQVSASA
jgi:glutathione S-transferase